MVSVKADPGSAEGTHPKKPQMAPLKPGSQSAHGSHQFISQGHCRNLRIRISDPIQQNYILYNALKLTRVIAVALSGNHIASSRGDAWDYYQHGHH